MNDNINHPSHYTAGKVECIDALEAATIGLVGIEAVCTAAAIKYLWRWKLKNGAEDLRKARWYLDRLISFVENAPQMTTSLKAAAEPTGTSTAKELEKCGAEGPWTKPIQGASSGVQRGICELENGHSGEHCCTYKETHHSWPSGLR